MHQPASVPRTLSSEEFARLIGRPTTRVLFICIICIIIGMVRGLQQDWPTPSLVLGAGGVLTILGTFLFAQSLSGTSRSIRGALSVLAGFVPYLFGLYLFAYEGVGGLWASFQPFSLLRLLMPLVFAYFGYRLIYWTWQLSEIAELRRTGAIIEND